MVDNTESSVSSLSDDIANILEDICENSALCINKNNKYQNKKLVNAIKILDQIDDDKTVEAINVSQIKNKLKVRRERSKEQDAQIKKLQSQVNDQQVKHKQLDEVLHRHQTIIDQLMLDKAALNNRCEQLLAEVETREEKYKAQLKAIESRHKEEIRKARDMALAGERSRREDWMASEKKKIKEATIKSLQSELNSTNNRFALREVELAQLHEQELNKLEYASSIRNQEQLENLRVQLHAEKESALVAEREKMQTWYADTMTAEVRTYEEQRKRWMKERSDRNKECEAREQAANAERILAVDRTKQDCFEQINAIKEKHKLDLNLVKEDMALELKVCKLELAKAMERSLLEKELDIQKRAKAERDKEIDKVIDEFHQEMIKVKKEHELKTKAVIAYHEKATKELEAKISDEQKIKVAAVVVLQDKIKVLSQDLQDKDLERDSITSDKNILQQKIYELENQILKQKQEYDRDIELFEERVKQALAKKDKKIAKLQEQLEDLQDVVEEHMNTTQLI